MRRYNVSRSLSEMFRIYQPHPYWDHSLAPGLHQVFHDQSQDRDCLFETNSQGFKSSRGIEMPKPPGVFRVFVLGDSFTEGLLCGPSAPHWIEEKLKAAYPGQKFEVINAGVSSLSVIPHIIRLRRQIFSLSPDLVVVNVDNTDVNDDLLLMPFVKRDQKGLPWEVRQKFIKYKAFHGRLMGSQKFLELCGGSYLLRILWTLWFETAWIPEWENEKIEAWRRQNPGDPDALLYYSWIKHKTLDENQQKLFKKWQPLIGELAGLCRERKVPLILGSYPHRDQIDNPQTGRLLQEFLKREAKRLGVPYYDPYEAFAAAPADSVYLPEDIHFNLNGLHVWGNLFGEFIAKEIKNLVSSSESQNQKGTAAP